MALVVLDTGQDSEAQLASVLKLSLDSNPSEYFLSQEQGVWVVRDVRQGPKFSIQIDLDGELSKLKRQRINPKKDLLSRALGYKPEVSQVILDGTLGFGKDSIHMVACGFQVKAVERNPVTAFLMEQAIEQSSLSDSIKLFKGETQDHLPTLCNEIDALYLDPMFENTAQKSAPKKSLAFLREISEVDLDVHRVIEQALQLNIKRVVVKRPLKGKQLYDNPNIVYEGKLIRYDVYTR